jgi:hypothetical protein
MRKPISTRTHGFLDYMTSGLLMTLPRALGWSRQTTCLLDAAAITATAYSLITRYELGVAKWLPMKAHLTLDAMSGGALLGAAYLMDDEDDEVRETIAALGAWEISAALLTQTRPPCPLGRYAGAANARELPITTQAPVQSMEAAAQI